MMTKSMILVVLATFATVQAGILSPAIVAPYASSYNAHYINHAVAHPLLAPAPVAVAPPTVFGVPAPAPAVLAAPAPAPAFLPAPIPAPALLPGPVAAPGLLAAPAPAPAFLPARAPLAFSAGLPGSFLWK